MNYLDFFQKAQKGTKFWDKFKDDPYGPKEIDSEDWPSIKELGHAAAYMLPVYGTYLSVNDAIEDPTWYNIGSAVLSGVGDIGTLAGVGWAGKAAVAASKASKLAKMTKGAEKAAHAAKAADKALDAQLHGIKAGETAVLKGMINTGTHGKAFNHKDGGEIQKAAAGVRTHSPNINIGVSIPFDRKPSFSFNVGDNIDTQSFRDLRASHSSNFSVGGYYSLDTGNGSVFGNYGRSFNNFPSISVSGSVPFSTKQMTPTKLTVPDSLDTGRRNTMLEFLKSKGKDPSRLSSNDVRDLTMMFQDGSGDDVLKRYNQLSGMFDKGGSIHIKKKNRGKFRDFCGGEVTEECIERGKHSSNPTTRKRATFAANARTWKHQEGGKVFFTRAFAGSNIKDKLQEFIGTPQATTTDTPAVEIPYLTGTSNDFSGYTLMDIDPAVAATTTSSGMRGMRNNNPGNIRISNNAWRGKKANNTDGVFEQFDSMAYGYRAMFQLIKTYYNKYGLTTPRQILQKYAPSADNNDPERYAQIVSEALGITPDTPINLNDQNQMVGLAQAITMVENGGEKGLVDDILEGLRMSNED